MYKYLLAFLMFVNFSCTSKATTINHAQDTTRSQGHYLFKNSDGKEVGFNDYKGKYVFIEIWSMSCVPCLREMPYVKELKERYKDENIEFVAICVDNNEPLWKDFLKRKNFTGNHWITPIMSPFLKENRFIAVPRFALLDQQGNILWNMAKYPSDPQLKKDLDQLFKL